MQITKLKRFSIKIILLIVFISLNAQVQASESGEASDRSRVISISPQQAPQIIGSRISSFSLAAIKGGRLSPIPFQVDERTESGYVYMKSLDKKAKKDDPILGEEGFFDANDEILFMFKDTGARKRAGMSSDGKILAEISVKAYDGKEGYVYLLEDSRLEAEDYYVRYSAQLGRVETDYYALKVDPKNAFMWQEFYYDKYDGAHPRKPIDTIKIEMKGNALGGVPVTLTNKNIVAKVIAEKSGPIRSTTQYKMTLTYLRTPLLNMKLQILHHEQEISYDAQTEVPPIRRRMVGKPSLKVSVDGYDLQGASVYIKNGPDEEGIVDGEISDIETQIIETPIEAGDTHWMSFDTHYGFLLFSNVRIEADQEVPMGVLYEDDNEKKTKSEYYKGQSPNIGFSVPFLPLKGSMRFIVDLKMFSEELDMSVKEFSKIINKADEIEFSYLQ